jgi:hypothetical protein
MKRLLPCAIIALFSASISSQTIEIKVRTATYWGQHTPRNCVAVWAADSMLNYLKTMMVTGSVIGKDSSVTPDATRNSLLNWSYAAEQNMSDTLDAITGATFKGHGNRTITWDCTDRNKQVVPDGRYIIFFEMTETNSFHDRSWPPPSQIFFIEKLGKDTIKTFPNRAFHDYWDQNPGYAAGVQDTIFTDQSIAYYAPSPGFVQFSAPKFVQRAGKTSVVFTVIRSRGRTGAVTVDYSTHDSTAKAGTDYTTKNGTISFANNDYAPKTISITLSGATLTQNPSLFTVSLANPGGGAILGSTLKAVVALFGPRGSIPENGMAANWNLDEGEGLTAYDASGNGNNGVMYSTSWKKLDKGYAAGFDTCQAWVDVGNRANLNIKGAVTLSAWVYVPTAAAADTNPKQLFLALGQYALDIQNGGRFHFGGPSYGVTTDTGAVPVSKWFHVAAVFSGNQGDAVTTSNAKIYVNNVMFNATAAGSWTSLDTAYGSLVIGVAGTPRPWSAYTGFTGMITNVYLYNRALGATEIVSLYNNAPVPVNYSAARLTESQEAMTVFVNQMSRLAMIRLPKLSSPAAVSVYNCFGKLVKRFDNVKAQTLSWKTGEVASGVYVIRVVAGEKRFYARMMLGR